ncbi:MAG: hypothetical protein RIC16_06660 [Rhodospirillales bacterium]
MKRSLVTRLVGVVLLVFAVVAAPHVVRSQASPAGFEALMDRAYGAFRSAYWYTRTGNLGVAAIEMMTFDQTWRSLRNSYEAAPPEIYANDAAWAATLAEIEAINSAALDQASEGDRDGAHQTISVLQRVFAELRARNGVVSFSDHVNDYDAVIRKLSTFRGWDKVLSEDDWLQMATLADDTDTAITSLEVNAPVILSSNPDFQRTIENNRQALFRFREHLSTRNERGAKGSIRDLRSAYGLLFLKYG